ncbi:hypothetical protein BDR03DRAFT_948587 [Suillus americanus]|nr:hypothetical protein BDR03DRAFT_948587 [Suillus americanus]
MDRPFGTFVSTTTFQACSRPSYQDKSNDPAVLVRVSCACVSERKFLSPELPRITLDQQAAISLRDYSLVKFLGDLHPVQSMVHPSHVCRDLDVVPALNLDIHQKYGFKKTMPEGD